MMPTQAPAFWQKSTPLSHLLLPLSAIFVLAVRLRRTLYRMGVFKSHRLPVPVIVVGNISVGGTGKTPLVIYLADLLKRSGYMPGIISRGYGGKAPTWPQRVTANSDAVQVGDEAVLIASLSHCPMAVGPNRVAAAKLLLEQSGCNVLISDDGLQHYALARDVEIAVIDGEHRFGNGYCLPAGPLREPVSRLRTVDLIVVNGDKASECEFSMRLSGTDAVNLFTGETKPLAEFMDTDCHALAGIGNPQRFFNALETVGIPCETHPFPDHHPFSGADICYPDDKPVLMTEKDAVKCKGFANHLHWSVPVKAELAAEFTGQLLHLLKTNHDR